MRVLAGLCLVSALVLAGCAGNEEPTTTSPPTGTQTGTTAPSSTTTTQGSPTTGPPTTGPPQENRPPTASLQASVAAGAVPLLVNFTLDGGDPDNTPLTWALDVDGDGTPDDTGDQLPTVTNHTYDVAGMFNVTFTVSDGQVSTSVHFIVNATEDAQAKATYVITNTFTGVDPTALAPTSACSGTAFFDIGGNWNPYEADLAGWTYAIEPAGKGFVAQFATPDAYVGSPQGETGTVPAEANEVDICTADPTSGGSYTFTATAP